MLGFSADAQDLPAQRARMVSEVQAMYAETQRETGFAAMSTDVARALGKVERHRLVPPGEASRAYRNHPLPIGSGQTITQPYIVALSTDRGRESSPRHCAASGDRGPTRGVRAGGAT